MEAWSTPSTTAINYQMSRDASELPIKNAVLGVSTLSLCLSLSLLLSFSPSVTYVYIRRIHCSLAKYDTCTRRRQKKMRQGREKERQKESVENKTMKIQNGRVSQKSHSGSTIALGIVIDDVIVSQRRRHTVIAHSTSNNHAIGDSAARERTHRERKRPRHTAAG